MSAKSIALNTPSDVRHALQMVKDGKLCPQVLQAAIDQIRYLSWVHCPIHIADQNRTQVEVLFCGEIAPGVQTQNGGEILDVVAIKNEIGQEETLRLTLSRPVPAADSCLLVPAMASYMQVTGITEEDLCAAERGIAK